MPVTYHDLRAGLAANIVGTLSGSAIYPETPDDGAFRVYTRTTLTVDAPAIVIGFFRRSEPLRGRLGRRQPGQPPLKAKWIIPVSVIVGDASELAAQDDLDLLADWNADAGIVAAIQSDDTLGGIAESVIVTSLGEYGYIGEGARFLGFDAIVEVVA